MSYPSLACHLLCEENIWMLWDLTGKDLLDRRIIGSTGHEIYYALSNVFFDNTIIHMEGLVT